MSEEKEKIRLVYAGRESATSYVYYVLGEDNRIGEKRVFVSSLSKHKSIGMIQDVETEGQSVFFYKNRIGNYDDFENKKELITEWRRDDRLIEYKIRAEKEVKDIHRYQDLREFKAWYKSKSSIEKQLILVDLVTFLNNTI